MEQYLVKYKNKKGEEASFSSNEESREGVIQKTITLCGCKESDIISAYPVEHTEGGLKEKIS